MNKIIRCVWINFLKVSRLIKRRTVANEACDTGRVSINGKVAKAAPALKPEIS